MATRKFNQEDGEDCPHQGDIATLLERSRNQEGQMGTFSAAIVKLTKALDDNTKAQTDMRINLVRMEWQHRASVAITGVISTVFGGAITLIAQHALHL